MSTPGGDKPYRVYRGGRTKGRVPTVGRPEKSPPRPKAERDGRSRYRGPGPKTTAGRPRQIRWGRELTIALVLIVAFFLAWAVLGYLVFRGGVSEANKRLPQNARRALTPDQGSLLSTPSAILLLGTDHSIAAARAGDRHSDSITLLRTDPPHHRLYYLSIPRDLRVEIPGYGSAKINTAFQVGGPRLAARTVVGLHRHPDQPHRRRQLRRVQRPDRRGRRDRHRRRRRRSSRSSTARTAPRRAARAGRAGGSPRASST